MLTSTELLDRAAAAGQANSNTSLQNLNEDYTNFLTLLTAQISNQDPLEPIDSTQFVSQLAQLSQVEQAVRTNSELESLNSRLNSVMNLAGTHLLGREVTIESDEVILKDGAVGSTYLLPEGAEEVSARIIDPLGTTVRTLTDLPTTPGEEIALGWDGKDDLGTDLLEGRYRVELTALDNLGEPVEARLQRSATVKEVLFRDGEIRFEMVDGTEVSSVTVKAAGTAD
jgi:flagellar basal-body rod modification protein FlgD